MRQPVIGHRKYSGDCLASNSSGMAMGGGQVLAGVLLPPLPEFASTSICFPGPRLRGQLSQTRLPPRLAWKRPPGCTPAGIVTAYFCTLVGRIGICTCKVELGPLPCGTMTMVSWPSSEAWNCWPGPTPEGTVTAKVCIIELERPEPPADIGEGLTGWPQEG